MVAFDIETELDSRRPSGQRLTCASVVDVQTNRLHQYDESTALDLVSLLMAERVIGFNILSFDLRVIGDYAGDYARRDLTALTDTLDLYRDLWQRTGRNDISLDELAAGTLGRARQSHGGNLFRLGQIRQLRTNSANGTREIAAIYRFGRDHQYVCWIDDRTGLPYEVPVTWT